MKTSMTKIIFCACILLTLNVQAASIVVDTLDDELNADGDCSFREALEAANTNVATDGCTAGSLAPTIDVITFSVSGVIFTSVFPQASHQIGTIPAHDPGYVTIDGGGNITLQGAGMADGPGIRVGRTNVTTQSVIVKGFEITGYDEGGISAERVANLTIEENVIHGITGANLGHGIRISHNLSTNINIINNTIGLDKLGNPSGNALNGVLIADRAKMVTITGNTISANGAHGIEAEGFAAVNDSQGHTISNNRIGTNIAGDDCGNPNSYGNGRDGIRFNGNVSDSTISNNIIGCNGRTADFGDDGASGDGIHMHGSNAPGNNVIENNFIGTEATGLIDLGNGGSGIYLDAATENTTISTNIIAYNGDGPPFIKRSGVDLFNPGTDCNQITQNSIYNNARQGIDLGSDGPTVNDLPANMNNWDADTGPNQLQNYPEISLANRLDSGNLDITFRVPSSPTQSNYPLSVEFFVVDNSQPKTYLGSLQFTMADWLAGVVTKTLIPLTPVNVDDVIGATATDDDGVNCQNTSELSDVVTVLPVTLSHFDSTRRGNNLKVNWSTSSELFNVGFQLWGLDGADGQWNKLHNWLVKSGSGNAVEPQGYRKKVKISTSIDELVALGISSVDSDGTEHYYGPFEVGKDYGDLASLEAIEWNDIRAQTDTSMASQGYIKDRVNGYRKVSVDSEAALTGDTQSMAQFNVHEDGMYRITASELLAAGVDLREVANRDLAVVDHLGHPVVRYVIAKGKGKGLNKTLGDKGEIYVYAKGPDVRAGLYTTSSVYRLIEDSGLAREALTQRKQRLSEGFATQYREDVIVETDKLYVFYSAADDPWLQSVVLSYPDQPRGALAYIDLPGDALVDEAVEIIIGAARSSALGGSGVEHLMQGAVIDANGQIVWLDTREAVGKGLWEQRFSVPSGTVLGDANGQVGVGALFSAGAGYAFSEVHTDYFGLSYVRPTTAKEGEDYLQFDGATETLGYDVTVPNGGTPWVFASDGSNLVRIVSESSRRIKSTDGSKQRRVRFAALQGTGDDPSIHYWVGSSSGAMRVEGLHSKSIVSQDALLAQAGGSDLLLIVHPAFMGADENGGDSVATYAEFKQSQGVTAAVLNYLDVVDSFGGGQSGPHGLTTYLDQLEAHFGVENVLIVGGSTYDHTNHLNTGAITFIPSHYGVSGYSNFTASDVPYITGTDKALFATMGRWPVRSRADLAVIVDKSMAWATRDHTNGSALLIAEHTIAGEEIDFSAALNGLEGVLPAQWSTHKVYVEQVAADNGLMLPGDLTQALSLSKARIIDELNNAPDLVLFNGHASTLQLSNNGLFKAGDIAQVTNEGAEIWLPLSCYVTFYESARVNTLAHQLLFTGNAVNITGAMLLSNHGENVATGNAILTGTMNDNQSIGEAVNAAKATQNNPQLNINWSILGDPTNRF